MEMMELRAIFLKSGQVPQKEVILSATPRSPSEISFQLDIVLITSNKETDLVQAYHRFNSFVPLIPKAAQVRFLKKVSLLGVLGNMKEQTEQTQKCIGRMELSQILRNESYGMEQGRRWLRMELIEHASQIQSTQVLINAISAAYLSRVGRLSQTALSTSGTLPVYHRFLSLFPLKCLTQASLPLFSFLKSHMDGHLQYLDITKTNHPDTLKELMRLNSISSPNCFTFLFWFPFISQSLAAQSLAAAHIVEHEGVYFPLMQLIMNCTSQHYNAYIAPFRHFMLQNSSYSVVALHQQLSLPTYSPFPTHSPSDIGALMDRKDASIWRNIASRPHETSMKTLHYYLVKSGISITGKLHWQRGASLLDPLHFLLIREELWMDPYSRDVLQVSLWLTLHSYLKCIGEKGENENYARRQMVAIVIYLLTLPIPTQMLCYYPIEQDLFRELLIIPIFPALLLKNKYFFQGYDWDKGKMSRPKINQWVLPWAAMITSAKTLPMYLGFEGGYEVALKTMRKRGGKCMDIGEAVTSAVTGQFQKMGGNLKMPASQVQNRKVAEGIPLKTKKILGEMLLVYGQNKLMDYIGV